LINVGGNLSDGDDDGGEPFCSTPRIGVGVEDTLWARDQH
jgi:hypothetical protein